MGYLKKMNFQTIDLNMSKTMTIWSKLIGELILAMFIYVLAKLLLLGPFV